MRIILSREIWPRNVLCTYSLLVGIALIIPAIFSLAPLAIDPNIGPSLASLNNFTGYSLPAFFTIVWIIPVACFVRWRVQFGTFSRRACACLLASVGLVVLPMVVAIPAFAHKGGGNNWAGAVVAQILLTGAATLAALFIAWMVTTILLWPVIFRLRPFRIQDGESCPHCGYCLRGVASRICPECGRAFSRHDLGLSEAAFDALVSAGQTETLAAASI